MKKAIIMILLLLTFMLGTTFLFSPIAEVSSIDSTVDLAKEPSTKLENEKGKITNILLLGVDSGREKYEAVRSDAILILSIDKVHQTLKLSSIMRDTYVEVEEKGKMKINEAYAYGGPLLTMHTINNNFNLDIESYVTVDFVGLSNIINALGGIELDIQQKEIQEINKYMEEVAAIKNEKATPLIKSGLQLLDGNQAVAYARIRKVGNGDFERTERQSNVMSALFNKFKEQKITQYPAIATKLLPFVKTNLSILEIIETATNAYSLKDTSIDWYSFPLYDYCQGEVINGKWVLTTDLEVTTGHLHQFIFDNDKIAPLQNSF